MPNVLAPVQMLTHRNDMLLTLHSKTAFSSYHLCFIIVFYTQIFRACVHCWLQWLIFI